MEFHQLEEDSDDLFYDIRTPAVPNLIENGLATVTVKGEDIDGVTNGDDDFGFTIHNKTAHLLHPYFFAFDSSDLSIKPWHLAPLGPAGDQHVDPLLLPRSTFPVGYGDSGAQPWSFWLSKGVLLTSSCLLQPSSQIFRFCVKNPLSATTSPRVVLIKNLGRSCNQMCGGRLRRQFFSSGRVVACSVRVSRQGTLLGYIIVHFAPKYSYNA